MQPNPLLPPHVLPAELAAHLRMSERAVEDKIKELGTYCKLGQTKIMLPHHVAAFMEAIECPSPSSSEAASGTTGALSPAGNYEELRVRLTKESPKGSRRSARRRSGGAT